MLLLIARLIVITIPSVHPHHLRSLPPWGYCIIHVSFHSNWYAGVTPWVVVIQRPPSAGSDRGVNVYHLAYHVRFSRRVNPFTSLINTVWAAEGVR